MTWYHWYWVIWFFALFGIMEAIALITGHSEWTLSAYVWHLCEVTPGQSIKAWTATHALLALGLIWLWFHFTFRWWH